MTERFCRAQSLPRSLYTDTARPAVDTPPLVGERSVEVAIVGGGYTGLSAALHLAGRGVEACVVERNEIGWGASGRNGGQVNPGLYPDPEAIAATFGEERGMRMLRFASGAPDLVFSLIEKHGITCEAARGGTIRAAFNASGARRVASTLGQLRDRGLPAEALGQAELAQATGTDRYNSAIFFPQGGKLNPLGYARGLGEAAIGAGATVHGATPALELAREGSRWRLRTPGGGLLAERIVLATNGYTDGLWPKLRRSIVPVYTTIVASAPLAPDIAARILPGGAVLYEVGNNTVYYRLDAENRLLMGGRSPIRDVTSMADAARLRQYAERLWPVLEGISWTHVWNGQVAITIDHNIHLHEPARGVLISLGYNGRGIAMATAMGEVLARRISGEAVETLPMPVTGLRPIRFHSLWKPATAARLAYGGLCDRLGF